MELSQIIAEKLVHTRLKESEDIQYKNKVESYLNHRLSDYETGVSVDTIKIISEAPNTITMKVDYSVDINIPYYDEETQSTIYEQETDSRSEIIVFSYDELDIK